MIMMVSVRQTYEGKVHGSNLPLSAPDWLHASVVVVASLFIPFKAKQPLHSVSGGNCAMVVNA